jgi:uncharacterized membrane protein YeaQ/YmgE (transglycosylase-associated protein family)
MERRAAEVRMFSLLWTMIIGLVAGALAKLIMPGKDGGGIWITMALGVVGAVLANVIGSAIGWYGPDHQAGFIGATIGAIVVLAIYRMVRGKRATV